MTKAMRLPKAIVRFYSMNNVNNMNKHMVKHSQIHEESTTPLLKLGVTSISTQPYPTS